MSFVIKCVGHEGIIRATNTALPEEHLGKYLERYDPEYLNGNGLAVWTDDLSKALRFTDALEAFILYRTVPKAKKKRLDGKPNRPLTAYSVELVEVTVAVIP
jgi:hypothetical protein